MRRVFKQFFQLTLFGTALWAGTGMSPPGLYASASEGVNIVMPSSGDAREASVAFDAGTAALQTGDAQAAAEQFSRALESRVLSAKDEALAYHHRGTANLQLGMPGHAVADLTNAIWHGALPASMLPRAYYNRGVAYARTGDLDRAERDYSKAIELNSAYALAYHNRGNIRRQKGAYALAVADYDAALDAGMKSRAALSLFGRGMSKDALGDKLAAAEDLERALSLDPSFELARSALASLAPQLREERAIAEKADKVEVVPGELEQQRPVPLEVAALPPIGGSKALTEPAPASKSEPAATASIGTAAAATRRAIATLDVEETRPPQVQVARLDDVLPLIRPGEAKAAPVSAPVPLMKARADAGLPLRQNIKLASLSGWEATVIRFGGTMPRPSFEPQHQISLRAPTAQVEEAAPHMTPKTPVKTEPPALEAPAAKVGIAPFRVQIGSFRSTEDADRAWTMASKKHGSLLEGLTPHVVKADLGERGIYYRLQVGAGDKGAASSLCGSLKEAGTDCLPVRTANAAG